MGSNITVDIATIMAFSTSMAVLFTFLVRLMVKGALSDFLKELNGTYVRSILFQERTADIDRRLSILEALTLPPHKALIKESHV